MTNDKEEPSAASAGSLVEERFLFRLAGHLNTTVGALKRHIDSEEIRYWISYMKWISR